MKNDSLKHGEFVKVKNHEGLYKVVSITEIGAIKRIELLDSKSREIITVMSPPTELESFLSPVEMILSQKFEDSDRFNLLIEANRLSCMHLYDPLISLSTTKITIFPHQVEAVYKMLDSYWPRYLLADDAGLGKTIMAGMLIKELELRKRISQVLIIAPAALIYQWRRELIERFDEKFTVMDSSRMSDYEEDEPDSNPWALSNHMIASMDFAKRDKTKK